MAISRVLAAVGVVGAGLCAAWPYRQAPPRAETAPPAAAPLLDVPLRQGDIVLVASSQAATSPATDLAAAAHDRAAAAGASSPSAKAPPSRKRTFELMNLAPPPPLPIAFQPGVSDPAAFSTWRPVRGEPPRVGPAQRELPRPYRLRDGDTLENIAERFLGDKKRAGEVFEANREVLAIPDLLPVGKTILIPPKAGGDVLTPAG